MLSYLEGIFSGGPVEFVPPSEGEETGFVLTVVGDYPVEVLEEHQPGPIAVADLGL